MFSDANDTVNISLNNNDDDAYCGLKIIINKKYNKIKTTVENNNDENNDFIDEETNQLNSFLEKTKNIKTASEIDDNEDGYIQNENNEKAVIDNEKNAENFEDETESGSEDRNTILGNLSCCSENFSNSVNNNNDISLPIDVADEDEDVKDNCNTNDEKTTASLSPLLTAMFSNSNKSCDTNNVSKIQQMFEAQSRFYSTLLLEQQRKNMSAIAAAKGFPLNLLNGAATIEKQKLAENSLPQNQLQQLQNLAKGEIKPELFNAFAGTLDKSQNKKVIFLNNNQIIFIKF